MRWSYAWRRGWRQNANVPHEPATTRQLQLFAEIGVDSLPTGMAALTTRERTFVMGFLRTGLAATAAREAGYSDPEADASKIRKRPKIAAVLAQACRTAGANSSALAAKMWQQQQAYFAEWQEIYPKVRALRAAGLPLPCSDEDKCQKNYLDVLHFLEDREKFVTSEMAKAAMFLKGIDINLSGGLAIEHTLPPELQAHLLQLQQGLKDLEAAP